ncbi:MAG: hypothetical protein OXC07_12105 [Kistimonas sp.]|nr:hypothetical protein [Kistimonas sp.]
MYKEWRISVSKVCKNREAIKNEMPSNLVVERMGRRAPCQHHALLEHRLYN